MDRNRDGPPRIVRMNEDVMATGNSIELEPRPRQCADDLPAVDDRQSAAGHDYAAIVTRRISGRASEGMAMP